jgi:predicted GNAT family acetyltransferase
VACHAVGVILRTASTRVLDDSDLPALAALLAADPIGNCSVTARIESYGLSPHRLGAQVWGSGGTLNAACYAGANLVPIGAEPAAVHAFAARAIGAGRRCSSIVGRVEAVEPLWSDLRAAWGTPRDIRANQPLLATVDEPPVESDALVRRVRPDELDILMPASIAMFTEEVGVSPLGNDGGALYRARMRGLIAGGRSFARIEDGRVVFKAELGAVSAAASQIQGVWVAPDCRGLGLSVGGMAAVVRAALRDVAPVVSLYVNDYNAAARAAYARVGLRQIGTFMSVLF